MKKSKIMFLAGAFFLVLASGVSAALTPKKNVPAVAYTNGDAETYYSGISDSLTGTQLLSALRSLNNSKRKKTIGYKNLADNYKYTDYDEHNVSFDSDGQPYSNKLVAFYSGSVQNQMSGMNKEHVWPKSRGGNLVEADIHMARPTLSKDNSSRGNSFYVEGSNSTSSGWDPKFALNSDITYRGDSARIIFYCTVANSQLSLVDLTNDNTANKTMGKLSDLIKWHLQYSVLKREMNRNEGAEYLQGNRNPFIDHPEYVCRIWGNTNEETKKLCAGSTDPVTPDVTLSSIEVKTKPTKIAYKAGETFDSTGMVVEATFSDGSKVNVTNQVTLNVSGVLNQVGTFAVTVTYSNKGVTKIATFNIAVSENGDVNPPEEAKQGCGGNIETTSAILSSLAVLGVGLILLKKYKKQDI